MRTISRLAAIAAVVSVLGCGSRDKAELEGTWKFIQVVNNGKEATAAQLEKGPLLFIEGDKMITKRSGKILDTWTYEIDSGRNPKRMTITMGEPDKARKHFYHYKLEGDTLTMCYTNEDFEKPFSTTVEPGAYFNVRKRVKE